MIFDLVRQYLLNKALLHTVSEQAILDHKQQNFESMLTSMTPKQKQFWFGNHTVTILNDLNSCKITTALDLILAQQLDPPYGPFNNGQILITSSGTTGSNKLYPYAYDNWLMYTVSAARGLLLHQCDSTDRILTTDIGGLQAGYRAIEDAATKICGAQLILDRSVSLESKLKHMDKFKVTVLVGNAKKLHRMAKLNPRLFFDHKLKMVINTGTPLANPEILCDAFGVDHIVDYYGSAEMGNISFTCQHGHQHINDDFFHTVNKNHKSYYSNISSLPVWNYELGDKLTYSYKGQCLCGSYLPTLDEFVPKGSDFSHKE
jgi:phenylacetate-coenzyme A ligase PaaK-like adenylate-forming protein